MNANFKTLVIAWLVALTMIWVCVVLFWGPICEHAALTLLKSAARDLTTAKEPDRILGGDKDLETIKTERRELDKWMEKHRPGD
jgi:hypothetical protein